jgi:hypothetical protein
VAALGFLFVLAACLVTGAPARASSLPDGRVYELVSPPDKAGGNIGGLGKTSSQAALNGDAVTFDSLASFAGDQGAKITDYLASRGASGWSTQSITPPDNVPTVAEGKEYEGFTGDLSTGVIEWSEAVLTPEAPAGYESLYIRDNRDGLYQLIASATEPKGGKLQFVGGSLDDSRIVFQADDALTQNAVAKSHNVYEWGAAGLSLASVPPGSNAGSPEAGAGDAAGNTQGAVSADGRFVFWTDSAKQLYVREDGTVTVKVNASRRTPSLGDGSATFESATPNGRKVLFADSTPLTNAVDDNGGLYELDTNSGELTDLTPDAVAPGVEGVLGFGGEGAYAYFVATSALTGSATAGQPNLYVSHQGAVTLVATLSTNDTSDWNPTPSGRTATVTADGLHAVFTSYASLTGYGNLDANTGKLDTEVFVYDAATSQLSCVSCKPDGTAPIGSSTLPKQLNSSYSGYYLSSDGNRVFFESLDAISARDTDGVKDVYEWERHGRGGCEAPQACVYLISSGTSGADSTFLAAGESGDDAFFQTNSQLVPQDEDEKIDVYDARVNGGFPLAPTPAPCSEEVCQGPLKAPPAAPSPLTASTPVPESGEAASRVPATFTVGSIGVQALRALARTGRLTLAVSVSQPGEVSAKMTAKLGRRSERLASGAVVASGPARLRLVLSLTRSERSRLARRRRVKVTIAVEYSKAKGVKSLDALASFGPVL